MDMSVYKTLQAGKTGQKKGRRSRFFLPRHSAMRGRIAAAPGMLGSSGIRKANGGSTIPSFATSAKQGSNAVRA